VASINICNAVEDAKRGSSWIVISHSQRLSILKFILDASPEALERLLLCFGCLESEIFQVYKMVLSLLDLNAFIGTPHMERTRSSVVSIHSHYPNPLLQLTCSVIKLQKLALRRLRRPDSQYLQKTGLESRNTWKTYTTLHIELLASH
jgi:hypothetical protein